MKDWQIRHERAKRLVGVAPSGTPEYYRNAAIVLSQHAGTEMGEVTRGKLEDLAMSSDPETRKIAQRALKGIPYNLDDLEQDDDEHPYDHEERYSIVDEQYLLDHRLEYDNPRDND